jgi:FtsH-binding integral membrane protein
MYNPQPAEYSAYGTGVGIAERGSVVGKVLSLLGFAFLFTAVGAYVGIRLGYGSFIISLIGTFACLFALMAFKERAPINLVLLYAFATFEGMTIGLILMQYVSAGLGGVVVNAALTTAVVTIAAGAYGATTKRDLSGMGGFLFIGLLGIIVASVIGIFVHSTLLYIGISVVAVLVFTGLLVFDLQRVSRARGISEGDTIWLTVSVYLDIVNLFLALLRIFGLAGGSNRD